jgi:hypothetical protein
VSLLCIFVRRFIRKLGTEHRKRLGLLGRQWTKVWRYFQFDATAVTLVELWRILIQPFFAWRICLIAVGKQQQSAEHTNKTALLTWSLFRNHNWRHVCMSEAKCGVSILGMLTNIADEGKERLDFKLGRNVDPVMELWTGTTLAISFSYTLERGPGRLDLTQFVVEKGIELQVGPKSYEQVGMRASMTAS